MSDMTVVVGVDGSPGARAALEFALDEAVHRHARLQVIAAVELPDYGITSFGTLIQLPKPDELVAEVRKTAQQQVDDVLAARSDLPSDLSISVDARTGRPGEVLCDAADSADLLVVGHRGRGSLTSKVLGSVGLHCVLNAGSTVAVVRTGSSAPAG